jgi:hypothetical protein
MRFSLALLSGVLLLCNCNLFPTAPKDSSSSGPLVTATISDGTGNFSVHGSTTVSGWTAGMYQVGVAGIETSSPGREIQIIVYCNTTDVGVALPLNEMTETQANQGLYSNTSQSTQAYAGPVAGTSGTITFDKLSLGSNTISGTFSFVAKRQPDGTTVTVSNGTFGK